MKRAVVVIGLLLTVCRANTVRAQDIAYARKVIDTLCSPYFAGRGYLDNGDKKAAEYIKAQFQQMGLRSFSAGYFQEFGFPVNVFPTDPEINIDGRDLIPGEDFIVDPSCRSVEGSYELCWVDSATIDDNKLFHYFEDKTHFRRSFLVLDAGLRKSQVKQKERLEKILGNGYKAFGIIELFDKLTWSVGLEQKLTPRLELKRGTITRNSRRIKLNIFSQVNSHGTQNVMAFVRGAEYPDSFIVFTAHYDHLGRMGKETYFPGANDNASGVALMLDLARHFGNANPKPKYSICFIAFAGEEAGLIGSYYYTQHPLFALKKIKFLVNLDLAGTGGKGATVVNATEFPEYFNKLEIANTVGSYLPVINQRGKAQNSDHHYFTEAGVKCFYIYLLGDYHYYHDVYDKAENLKLEGYLGTFSLLRDFVKEIEEY